MAIDNIISEINSKLDIVISEYENTPGFKHPLNQEFSPKKSYWGFKLSKTNYYIWVLFYGTGISKDNSAITIKYFPKQNSLYQIIWDEEKESGRAEMDSYDLNDIVKMFELTIQENIIGSRPKINLGVF